MNDLLRIALSLSLQITVEKRICTVDLGRRSLALGGHYQLSDSNLSKRVALDSLAESGLASFLFKSGLETYRASRDSRSFLSSRDSIAFLLSWSSTNSYVNSVYA